MRHMSPCIKAHYKKLETLSAKIGFEAFWNASDDRPDWFFFSWLFGNCLWYRWKARHSRTVSFLNQSSLLCPCDLPGNPAWRPVWFRLCPPVSWRNLLIAALLMRWWWHNCRRVSANAWANWATPLPVVSRLLQRAWRQWNRPRRSLRWLRRSNRTAWHLQGLKAESLHTSRRRIPFLFTFEVLYTSKTLCIIDFGGSCWSVSYCTRSAEGRPGRKEKCWDESEASGTRLEGCKEDPTGSV